MTVISRYKLEITGAILGAVGGWLYWNFVGCASGACAITSSPVNSTIYGLVMGALAFSLLRKNESVKK